MQEPQQVSTSSLPSKIISIFFTISIKLVSPLIFMGTCLHLIIQVHKILSISKCKQTNKRSKCWSLYYFKIVLSLIQRLRMSWEKKNTGLLDFASQGHSIFKDSSMPFY